MEQPKLAGHLVAAVSPDGQRLLTSRFRPEPEGYDQVLLDRATLKPIDLGNHGLSLMHFVTDDTLLGPRAKGEALEHCFLKVTTKTVAPVPMPKELNSESVKLGAILPSPDGRRLLYAWDEKVPAPADWNSTAPCRPARLTVADIDGSGAKTIFRPQINARADICRAHWGTLDWR